MRSMESQNNNDLDVLSTEQALVQPVQIDQQAQPQVCPNCQHQLNQAESAKDKEQETPIENE